MKRSEINRYLLRGIELFEANHFSLPPFAYFKLDDWRRHRYAADEIFSLQLGWDVTSFGSNDFVGTGLLSFTLRNGALGSNTYTKPYAEKVMMVGEGQVTPRHFHWHKCEDIINRGGGNLVIEVWTADERLRIMDESFELTVDGIRRGFSSGDHLVLIPGESVCLEPYVAHRFYGEKGAGSVMVGEVSMVNDDSNDNCFIDGQLRFDEIEDDEVPLYYLASDYDQLLRELT